jgi:hypothetical protein
MREPPEDETAPVEGEATDDELVEQLRGVAAQADPVPETFLRAARGSYTWRIVDHELAELAYDSLLDDARTPVVRGGGDIRLLTFEAPELTIELEVTVSGNDRRIAGQLIPEIEAIVEISHGGGTEVITTDRLGRFAAGPVTAGPVSLSCRRAGALAAVVSTEWVPI